jgi:hypothetical protein
MSSITSFLDETISSYDEKRGTLLDRSADLRVHSTTKPRMTSEDRIVKIIAPHGQSAAPVNWSASANPGTMRVGQKAGFSLTGTTPSSCLPRALDKSIHAQFSWDMSFGLARTIGDAQILTVP